VFLLASAKQRTIGKTVDDAMLTVERDNLTLKGVLPKDYAHPRLDKQRLGQLIDMIGNIGLGDKIELNRRMNATLEAMARALFKS
jgi:type I restriction enzyme M protein